MSRRTSGRWGRRLATAGLLAASLAVALLAGELVFRFAIPTPASKPPRAVARTCGDCGYLYELDPAHPGISEQRTRDRPVEIPKPSGRFRILVLGDSVAFGARVRRREAFPERLEASLAASALPIDVVNAAVSGYSTWNEARWLAERGSLFEPDLVLVATCWNDVVDPLPHWARGVPVLAEVPVEAIPDPEAHAREIVPLVRWRTWKHRLGERSALLRRVATTLLPHVERWLPFAAGSAPVRVVGGRDWPAHLTLEDDLALDVLLDPASPQWRWLRRQIDSLAVTSERLGARLVFVVFPLAYQMDPAYPFLPEEIFLRGCEERGLACLDLLPVLRSAGTRAELWVDDWHLSPRGHAVAAAAIERFLGAAAFLPCVDCGP
jgi:lysophospholipase L1-like esterase